jgi:hypothetical protein
MDVFWSATERLYQMDTIIMALHFIPIVAIQHMQRLMHWDSVLKKNAVFKRNKNLISKKTDRKNITLYVVQLGKTKEMPLKNSAPCYNCMKILNQTNMIKKMIYSDENGNIISVRMRDYTTTYFTIGDKNI